MAMIAARVRFGSTLINTTVPARCFARVKRTQEWPGADQETHPDGLTHRISTYFMPQVQTAPAAFFSSPRCADTRSARQPRDGASHLNI